MRILHELHMEGRTIILITHDNEIAEQASRVIRIRDGRIMEDSFNTHIKLLSPIDQTEEEDAL